MEIILALDQNLWLLTTMLTLAGLCVGSFLNVVIFRLPVMMERRWRADCCELLEHDEPVSADTKSNGDGEETQVRFNLMYPNSHCPQCDHAIRPWENIPLLSYLLLRGRCSACSTSISLRYPAIELVSGLLILALGLHYAAATPALLGAVLLTFSLLTLTMIDIDHQLLPDDITLPLLWLGLLFNLFGVYTDLASAVIGAVAGYLSLWSVYWLFKLVTGKEGMGYGDFKLLAALGAWLGWQYLPIILLLSSLVGTVIGLALIFARKRGRDIPMPFGPYLAIAGWIALLWGQSLLDLYWQTAGANSLQ